MGAIYEAEANTVKQCSSRCPRALLRLNRLIPSGAAGRRDDRHRAAGRRGWLPDFGIDMLRRANDTARPRKLLTQVVFSVRTMDLDFAALPDRCLRVRVRARIRIELVCLGRDWGLRRRRSLRRDYRRHQQRRYCEADKSDVATHDTLPPRADMRDGDNGLTGGRVPLSCRW